ncbi:MAG: cytidine deaminase [Bacteroidia bacterium]|nr:cytidine deaminase [Bacteroidia bacterium]
MKPVELRINLKEYDSPLELPEAERELIAAAAAAGTKAYAPFSGFEVGAALRLDDGSIHTGSNQESEAFPSGLCAERTLLFHVLSNFPDRKITAMAIVCRSEKDRIRTPQTPCGACRQILLEAETRSGSPLPLILRGEEGPVWILASASLLMPWPFRLEH